MLFVYNGIMTHITLFLTSKIALFFMLLLLGCTGLAADLSIQQKKALLEPIEKHAMVYGEGSKKVYVFVDPKCPHSRDFISMINESTKMRSIYRYYIFFYELKRFQSHSLIASIYASPVPLQRTLEVMVGLKETETTHAPGAKVEEKITEIAKVAEEIGVSKRPYLIIVKEQN